MACVRVGMHVGELFLFKRERFCMSKVLNCSWYLNMHVSNACETKWRNVRGSRLF